MATEVAHNPDIVAREKAKVTWDLAPRHSESSQHLLQDQPADNHGHVTAHLGT